MKNATTIYKQFIPPKWTCWEKSENKKEVYSFFLATEPTQIRYRTLNKRKTFQEESWRTSCNWRRTAYPVVLWTLFVTIVFLVLFYTIPAKIPTNLRNWQNTQSIVSFPSFCSLNLATFFPCSIVPITIFLLTTCNLSFVSLVFLLSGRPKIHRGFELWRAWALAAAYRRTQPSSCIFRFSHVFCFVFSGSAD